MGGLLRILTCVKRGITVDVRHADCRGMSVIEVGRCGACGACLCKKISMCYNGISLNFRLMDTLLMYEPQN